MNQYDENAAVCKEQQSIKLQQEKAIKEAERANLGKVEKERLVDSQRNEKRRLADERRVGEAKLQERLRMESERRKKEQRKKYSIAVQGNYIVTQSVRIAEQSVQMLCDDTKTIISMSRELLQKRAEEKKLTEGECNKIIKTYEMLKSNLNQLDKLEQIMGGEIGYINCWRKQERPWRNVLDCR